MTREEDINPKQESNSYTDCSICCESFTPKTKIVLFFCCSTDSDLKVLDSICAEKTFAEEFRCPYCRAEDEELKFITLDYELFNNLTLLSEKELKEILDQRETQSPEAMLENIKLKLTLTPEQKDLRDFLRNNKLLSKEYFDNSPLPVKLRKLLDDNVLHDVMLTALRKFLAAGSNINGVDKYGYSAFHFICQNWPKSVPHETILTVVENLLKTGADETAVNLKGKTPLQILEDSPDENSKKLARSIHSLIIVSVYEKKNYSAEQIISTFNKSTCKLETIIQIAGQYVFQKMDANQIEAAIKIWNWIHKNSLRVQEFEKFIMTSENFNYLLSFAWTLSSLNKSFRKSSEVISSYHRAVELLLTQKNHFVLSKEHSKILEEVADFDEQLTPQLSMGLNLALATNIAAYDINKAQRYFLQAAKTGWLIGYILPSQQLKYREDPVTSTDEAILYLRGIVFSPHAAANSLNKKCFTFALASLRVYATNKEILALKTLGDYYQKIEKTKEAIDFFLQTKNKAEIIRQQQLANEKIEALISETTLALGQLSYESGAILKACQEYGYGPACIAMARMCIKDESESQFFEVVKYLCQAMTTAYQPQAKTALEDLAKLASLFQKDVKACFKLISTLADFIDANKDDITALQIPLLMKLIQTLKLEKLFLENTDREEKFELFSHKFSSKIHFSTDLARAFILLTENKSIQETRKIIETDVNKGKIIAFYKQIFKGDSELLAHLTNREIRQYAQALIRPQYPISDPGLEEFLEQEYLSESRFNSTCL